MRDYEALLRLQEIDLELMRYSRTLKAMPQQRKLAAIRQAKHKVAGELTRIVGQRKDAETDIADSEAEHERLTAEAEDARAKAADAETGYREAKNLEARLTTLAKRLEKIEYNHGEQMEQLEKLRKAERNARGLEDKLDQERQAQEDSFKQETADLMAKVRSLADERKGLVAALPEETVKKYDAAAKRFGGLAVERLHGNVPSVCRVKLQPSQYADLRRADAITECPYCHRLLVTEDVVE